MSTWRALTKNLYAIGGKGPRCAFDHGIAACDATVKFGVRTMRKLGLVVRSGDEYELTSLGVQWCRGEVVDRRVRHSSRLSHLYGKESVGIVFVQRSLNKSACDAQFTAGAIAKDASISGGVDRIYPVEIAEELCSP
jgi:hypothetical protein